MECKMKLFVTMRNHAKGDTFRELIEMWDESNYIVIEDSHDRFCWTGDGVGDVLLYEYARFDFLPKTWNKGLFSNTQAWNVPIGKNHPWIFWSRHPRKLESKIKEGIKSFDDRDTKSIFLGKIENPIQYENRMTHDWSTCIEEFSMPVAIGNVYEYPYTQDEYLNKVSRSRYGLVLPGYGPKCNREIEYFGLGTVPIYTKGCGLDYYDKLEEGVHYFYASSPNEVAAIVNNVSSTQWKEMSKNGRDWYERNCSRKGSYDTTKRIVESI